MAGEAVEGYGAIVTGAAGASSPLDYLVTSLADSGVGTLRDALHSTNGTKGDRFVHFQPGLVGNIPILSQFIVGGRNITIDKVDAPGVTIGNNASSQGLTIDGRNIIFRNMRVRNLILTPNSGIDGFNIRGGAEGLVFDHVSISEVADECFSINPDFPGFWAGTASQYGLPLGGAGRVTIQWSIFGPNFAAPGVAPNGSDQKSMKLGGARLISIHHSIYYQSWDRMPRMTNSDICDFRNNIIARWRSGTAPNGFHARGATAGSAALVNSINNYFAGPEPGFAPNNGWNQDGFDDDGNGVKLLPNCYETGTTRWDNGTFPVTGTRQNTLPPHNAPAVTTQSALQAAILVLASAGPVQRDAVDQAIINWILGQDTRLNATAVIPATLGGGIALAGQVLG